jgi:glycosyltransferase involved in cell wall biosynthesis
MNVGLVVPGFSANAADWCIPALCHLARCLANRDDVRVIAVRYPYRRARYTVDGVEVIALGGAQRRGPGTLPLWREALNLIRAEHRGRPFDALHAFWATESGLLAAIAGRLLRVPTLVSLAGGELVALRDVGYGDQRSAWERLKVAASLRMATAVSAGSRLLLGLAAGHVPRGRLQRAPLGVDLDLFQPGRDPRPEAPRRFIHVGALVPVKDHATLLQAFATVQRGEACATLDLVGEGPLRSRLQHMAKELGLESHVTFRGDVDHAALPALYRAADALVISSRHEAQCMAALEAAACGLAIVGTRVGVIPELTSSVAPIGDAIALAQTMAEAPIPADPALFERVRSEFELNVCADRFRALYARLALA